MVGPPNNEKISFLAPPLRGGHRNEGAATVRPCPRPQKSISVAIAAAGSTASPSSTRGGRPKRQHVNVASPKLFLMVVRALK